MESLLIETYEIGENAQNKDLRGAKLVCPQPVPLAQHSPKCFGISISIVRTIANTIIKATGSVGERGISLRTRTISENFGSGTFKTACLAQMETKATLRLRSIPKSTHDDVVYHIPKVRLIPFY